MLDSGSRIEFQQEWVSKMDLNFIFHLQEENSMLKLLGFFFLNGVRGIAGEMAQQLETPTSLPED